MCFSKSLQRIATQTPAVKLVCRECQRTLLIRRQYYLSHCWLRSVLPYGVTRPQWVSPILATGDCSDFSISYIIFSKSNDKFTDWMKLWQKTSQTRSWPAIWQLLWEPSFAINFLNNHKTQTIAVWLWEWLICVSSEITNNPVVQVCYVYGMQFSYLAVEWKSWLVYI